MPSTRRSGAWPSAGTRPRLGAAIGTRNVSRSYVVSTSTRVAQAGRVISAARGDAVEYGHPDVHQHDVGEGSPHGLDRLAPVGRPARRQSSHRERSSTISSPERTRSWSSATTTRDRRRHGRATGGGRVELETAVDGTPWLSLPAEESHALGDPHPGRGRLRTRPRPLLGLVALVSTGRPWVAQPGGSRAVWSVPYLSAFVSASCTIRYADTSTPPRTRGASHSGTSRSMVSPLARNAATRAGQVGQPRRGSRPSRRRRHAARAAAGRSRRSPRRPVSATSASSVVGTVGVLVHEVLRCCCLDDHGADGMGDDVVHVAGDAVALVANRLAADQLLPFLQQLLLVREATRDPAEDVRRRDERQHEDHVRDVVVAGVGERVVRQHQHEEGGDPDQTAEVGQPAAEGVDADGHDPGSAWRARRAAAPKYGISNRSSDGVMANTIGWRRRPTSSVHATSSSRTPSLHPSYRSETSSSDTDDRDAGGDQDVPPVESGEHSSNVGPSGVAVSQPRGGDRFDRGVDDVGLLPFLASKQDER